MEKTGKKTSLKRTGTLLSCLLLCILVLAGCGRSLVITTGFRHGEVFRLGKEKCRIAEMKVYLLDLQKQSEAMYGDAIWESEAKEDLQQAVKDQALAQLTRVKALKSMGVSMNIMLTNEEEDLAAAARNKYFAALSQEEKKYIGLDEKKILKVFEDYALAERMWKSFGDSALQEYEKFFEKTQCDLNIKYWQKVSLKKIEGDPQAPGFIECCEEQFAKDRAFLTEETEEDGADWPAPPAWCSFFFLSLPAGSSISEM